MKKWALAAVILAFELAASPNAVADPILQQVHINVDGNTQDTLAGFTNGLNANGLGTLTFTDTRVGTDFVDLIFDYEVAAPFFNEYGAAIGTVSAGETWSIDDWYDNSSSPTPGSGSQTNVNDAWDQVDGGGALLDNNLLPGQLSNFNANCSSTANAHLGGSGANCNGDVAGALGFGYTLGAGQQAFITITASTTAPTSGSALKLVHPGDPGNPAEADVYLSGTVSTTSPVPEPGSFLLLGTGSAGLLAFGRLSPFLRRKRR